MATIYLIDAHTNPIANSQINDVQFTDENDRVVLTDNFPYRIGDDISIDPPDTLADLQASKPLAILANYPGFANAVFDDLTDATGISTANSASYNAGSRQTVALTGPGTAGSARIQTTTTALGATPTQFVLLWEAYQVIWNEDPIDGRLTREYQDGTAASLEAEVSFNNGSSYLTGILNGASTIIPGADQGTNLIVRIQDSSNTVSTPTYINSWTLLF